MNTKFLQILDNSSADVKSIALAARKVILDIHPDATEVIWENAREAGYGFGEKKLSEHHTRILLNKAHVTLMFEHGVALLNQDEDNLLEGAGAKCRHIKLKQISDTESDGVKRMIKISVAERKNALER